MNRDEVIEMVARQIAGTHHMFDERYGPATAEEFYEEAKAILNLTIDGKKVLAVISDDQIVMDKSLYWEIKPLLVGMEFKQQADPSITWRTSLAATLDKLRDFEAGWKRIEGGGE